MNLTLFRTKVKNFVKFAGYSQAQLATALGFTMYTLSHKLNNSDGAKLSSIELKQLIKKLVEWEAINQKTDVLELLELAGLDAASFTQEEWQASPLNRLEKVAAFHSPSDSAQTPTANPDPKESELAKHNLPVSLNSFIGRQEELAELAQILTGPQTRLVTLTGTGGIGKTRLLLQLAHRLTTNFRDGVWLVELATLTDPAALPQLLAQTLTIPLPSAATPAAILAAVIEHLKPCQVLLALDNCEHLVEAIGETVYQLLSACPHLKILATSREVLNVPGELCHQLPVLTFPSFETGATLPLTTLLEFEAVNLFVQRATLHNPEFQLTEQNALPIAQICAQVEGIPLALELAAVWVRTLNPSQIQRQLTNRLQLLNTTRLKPGSPARHQTLQATLDWSYNLLPAAQQDFWKELIVFVGSWNLEAVQTICWQQTQNAERELAVMELLAQLEAKSLLVVEQTSQGEQRYRMLAPVREYIFTKLLSQQNNPKIMQGLRERHLAYYLQLVQTYQKDLQASNQKNLLLGLKIEWDNIRTALEWSLAANKTQTDFWGNGGENERKTSLQLVGLLGEFWYYQSRFAEASGYIEQALQNIVSWQADYNHTGKALYWLGRMKGGLGLLEEGAFQLKQAVEHYQKVNNIGGLIECFNALGSLAQVQHKSSEGLTYYRLAQDLANEHNNILGLLHALNGLAVISVDLKKPVEARSYFEQAMNLISQVTAPRWQAVILTNYGNLLFLEKDYPNAERSYRQSLASWQELGDRGNAALCIYNLASVAQEQGDLEQSMSLFEESRTLAQAISMNALVASIWQRIGNLAHNQEDYALAQKAYRESEAVFRGLHDHCGIAQIIFDLGRLAISRGNLTLATEHFFSVIGLLEKIENKALNAEVLAYLALNLTLSGEAQDLANRTQVRQYLKESLTLWTELEQRQGMLEVLAICVITESGLADNILEGGASALMQLQPQSSQVQKAAYLAGIVAGKMQNEQMVLPKLIRSIYERALISMEAQLGKVEFKRLYEQGLEEATTTSLPVKFF